MITCLIRKKQVVASPEENVRQACLYWMVHTLGYPLESIAVEQKIKDLNRRLDILVYSKGIPFLVIECKALKITPYALRQLLGYHHWLKTPFAALAGQDGIKTVFLKDGEIQTLDGLPKYAQLVSFSS